MSAGGCTNAEQPMVLQVGPLATSMERALRANFNAVRLPTNESERAQFMLTHAHDITVIVTSGRTGAPATLIDELPALAAIVHTTAGYDATDIQAATKRSIVVSNTPDVLNDCVADTAVGLMIDVLRQFSASDRFLRAGGWAIGHYPLTRQVSNTSVGIIGLGRIGTAIAKRLEAFGCRITYHNRRPVPRSSYTYVGSPQELARGVDVLIVAAAGGASSRHLVDRNTLQALGPNGYLINVARGSVVDQHALVDELTKGRLAGAGLDVYTDEPNVPSVLVDLDNVVLLPHVGSATVQTRAAMEQLALQNLESFIKSGELVTPI